MLQEFPYMDTLRGLVNNYERFKLVAANIEWVDAKSEHYDFSPQYPIGLNAHLTHFPAGYISERFEDALVQAMLMEEAWFEGWDSDFWNISREERLYCLDNGEEMYSGNITFMKTRLTIEEPGFIFNVIKSYESEDCIFSDEAIQFIERFSNTPMVDLGSNCITPDYSWLCVQGDDLLMLSFGVWD